MQPTEKLYEADAFTRRFTAAVLACEPVPGGWRAALDRTAFYPEGGGQPEIALPLPLPAAGVEGAEGSVIDAVL